MEIVEGYFALGKASRALVVVSEHNTAYNNEEDTMAGHLWGDGAAALLFTKEPPAAPPTCALREVTHRRRGPIGKADEAVTLQAGRKRHRDALRPRRVSAGLHLHGARHAATARPPRASWPTS
ncbi:MAG: hypothetical protein WKG07_22145 [Hymenobacter sp.]